MPYLIVMFLGVVLSLIVRYWGSGWVIHLFWFNFELCDSAKCAGYEAVYRISAAMTVWFALHALCMLHPKTKKFHTDYWIFKILLLFGLIVGFYLIPNPPFDVYAIIARFVSGFFLLLQIIILIEFAYQWNASWVSDEKGWYWQILAVCGVLYGASIVLAVFEFRWFTDGMSGECKQEQFFIGFTIALTSLVTLMSISWWCKHGALLPSAVVTLYCFYLCYSSLVSDPSPCNNLQDQTTAQIIVGIIIAATTVTYASWNLSNSATIFGVDEDEIKEHEEADVEAAKPAAASDGAAADGDKKEEAAEDDGPEDEKAEWRRKRNLKFHLVMAVASMYVAMLLTSWGSETGTSGTSYDLSEVAMWIKIVSLWITILLYTWTLVAPYLFPDRDFGVDGGGDD